MSCIAKAHTFSLLWLSIGLLISIAACKAENAAEPSAEPKKAPVDNSAFIAYVPKGWVLQDDRLLDIDINGDGIKDAILTAIEDKNSNKGDLPDVDDERALLVLLGDKQGKYDRISFAKNAILCGSCAGMMGTFGSEAPGVILYEDNAFIVGWTSGSRDTVDIGLRFIFDAKSKSFVLLSDRVEKADRVEGKSVTTRRNFFAGTQTVGEKVSKIDKKVIPLEAVKYYDYLGHK